MKLIAADKSAIDGAAIEKRFKSFNNSGYLIQSISFEGLESGLNIPFKELTLLKNRLAFLLNGSVDIVPTVEIAPLMQHEKTDAKPSMSILIADLKDLICVMRRTPTCILNYRKALKWVAGNTLISSLTIRG